MNNGQYKRAFVGLLIAATISAITLFCVLVCKVSAHAVSSTISRKDQVHAIAEMARDIGLPESDPIIIRAQALWKEADDKFCADRDIIACVVYNEAWGGCTDRHRELVAAVVCNRLASSYGGATSIYEVVAAPGQYLKAYATPGSYYWNLATKDPTVWAECQRIATKALNGEVICPSNVFGQAESKQGDVYEVCKTSYSTTYFCYG